MEDVLKSITAAIALAKQLVGLVGDTKNVELKMVVADLSVELAQVKMQLAELMDQNATLKQKLSVAKGGGPQTRIPRWLVYRLRGRRSILSGLL